MPREEAVAQAVELGFAEPGTASWLDVIRAEAEGDIAKKASIPFNANKLGSEFIDWHDLRFSLSGEQIVQALDEGRRFIISYYPLRNRGSYQEPEPGEVLGGFDVEHSGWRLVGGFREVSRHAILATLEGLQGPGNGFVVGLGSNNSHGEYSLVGPGAGAGPTTSAMLGDWQRMREQAPSASNPQVEVAKPKTNVVAFRLDDIKTGEIDERGMDDNTFYAVTNWLTGWEPVWAQTGVRSDEERIFREMFAKEQELTAKGRQVRFTPNCVTVGEDEMTIRYADGNFTAVTLWTVHDETLHRRYNGPKQVDIWWGLGQQTLAS